MSISKKSTLLKWLFMPVALIAGICVVYTGYDDTHRAYTVTDLGDLTEHGRYDYRVTDAGKVEIYPSVLADDSVAEKRASSGDLPDFVKIKGKMMEIGNLGGYSTDAVRINAHGQITGDCTLSTNRHHAFLYSNGILHDIGTLGGLNSYGNGINAMGQVTGSSEIPPKPGQSYLGYADSHAFLYSNGKIHDIGTLGGRESEGTAINDKGEIVGLSRTADQKTKDAFLYSHGVMYDLNDQIPHSLFALVNIDAARPLNYALSINNKGQIIAVGTVHWPLHNTLHYYLLTPIKTAPKS